MYVFGVLTATVLPLLLGPLVTKARKYMYADMYGYTYINISYAFS